MKLRVVHDLCSVLCSQHEVIDPDGVVQYSEQAPVNYADINAKYTLDIPTHHTTIESLMMLSAVIPCTRN